MPKFGTSDWWKEHANLMNTDEEYRKGAKGFSSTFIYVIAENRVFAKFIDGEVVDVHDAALNEDAEYVIEADPKVWTDMAKGKQSPKLAIMTGKIKIAKGNKMSLIGWINPCAKLFTNMVKVNTEF